jgi:ribosome biogenesis GTPase / thiamine phosphate phosphatase
MVSKHLDLNRLGISAWFEDKVDAVLWDGCEIARVITVDKEKYLIRSADEDVPAEITGKLMFSAESALDYPTVGDWVVAQYFDGGSFAIIHDILPRKSVLKRKTSGKRIDFQLIAANIDTALVIQSLDGNYNLRRLERYLTMINESKIRPVVLLSKSDLLSRDEIAAKISEIQSMAPRIQIAAFSNKSRSGLDEVKTILVPGKTICLLGSSGVGKTTLLNNLLGRLAYDTRAVREKDGKGKHTTTRRQLIILDDGGIIIDTPGMRELGNFGIETGLNATFDEIVTLSAGCRYNDCSHTIEKDCTVLAAVEQGRISRERYENFTKMRKESEYYEMSYLDKKRKDKKFGKMIKSVLKNKVKK